MIAYAKRVRPNLHLEVGDMRSVRLGRTFDAVLSLGSALMYAIEEKDIEATLATFAAHCHVGSLLILDMNNSVGYLPGGSFKETTEYSISTPEFSAHAVANFSFDRRRQLLIRNRTWTFQSGPPVEDYCRFRMFFPAELEQRLKAIGFRVVEMFDNKNFLPSDLTGRTLYVAAIFGA